MNSKGRPLLTSALLALPAFGVSNAASVLAQGTVIFANDAKFSVVCHVYLPSPAFPGLVQIGNGPSDVPAGTTDWTGWTPVSGTGFSAQLFGAEGRDVPVDSLAPALPITTFGTGPGAGFVNQVVVALANVPWPNPATVQMRVWDNKGGTIADWATALAQPPGTEILGMSTRTDLPFTGGGLGFPPPFLVGLQSFNLTYNVPEPSPFALFGFGAFSLWLSCGRKRWMKSRSG
jgi:hypothetical protein